MVVCHAVFYTSQTLPHLPSDLNLNLNLRPTNKNHNTTATMSDIKAMLKDSKAEYRQLGKSGLRVSVPILGAMSIGDKKWQPWVVEEEEALPILKAAYDKGITSWDTGTFLPSSPSNLLPIGC
jgi:hypothetical protein